MAVLISRLRSVLGRERIQRRDGGYVLVCDWLDASELAALTEEMDRRRAAGNLLGAAAAARVALSLLRGYAPPQVPGEWAQLRLAELDRLAGRARQVGAAVLLEAGDWMAAADVATVAVEADGYDEASLRVLLRAYVAGGRVAAALAAYAQARERLAAELGTDPSPETVALYTAILRGELPAPAAAAARGPAGLVARDEELAYLDTITRQARDGSTEIVVVDGNSRIGKTALLRAWAAQREGAGDVVLAAACGRLDRSMPLDALLSALSALLRRLGPDAAADLLAQDAPMLAPLLGVGPLSSRAEPILADSMLGPAVLYAALVRVLGRLAARGPLVVVIDDAHLAGLPLANWLSFARREGMPVAVVAAVRSGEEPPMPATAFVHLGLLGREAVAELVGPSRADELYERSKGHPLFLTELAQQAGRAELPASLVESVSARCDELRPGAMLRAGAVIGPELDIELLAALLGRPAVDLLDDAERAVAKQLLAADDGAFRFRHELVREALAASATQGGPRCCTGRRAACWPGSRMPIRPWWPITRGSAATWRWPPSRCAPRPSGPPSALTMRRPRRCWTTLCGCIRTSTGGSSGPGCVPAAAGTPRRWPMSIEQRGRRRRAGGRRVGLLFRPALRSGRPVRRGRRAGRVGHPHPVPLPGRRRPDAARGPGSGAKAELLLGEAFSLAEGADQGDRSGVAGRAARSPEQGRRGAGPAAARRPRDRRGGAHGSDPALVAVHRACACRGEQALALDAFSHYAEVERRQVPRFAGRAVNFAGWVLRSLGASAQAADHHRAALELGQSQGTAEVTIAALEDLAEQCVESGDPGGAQEQLAQARALLTGDLVFGWRLDLKHRLITARLALLRGDAAAALAAAAELQTRAALGVPRYLAVARILTHRARRALDLPVDLDMVAADLSLLEEAVAVEAWWWTGETACDLAVPAWLDLSAEQAERLARQAATPTRCAGRRRVGWTPGGLRRAGYGGRVTAGGASTGGEHQHRHDQRPGARDGGGCGPPQLSPPGGGQRVHERGDVGHAQPPRGEPVGALQPDLDRDRPQAYAGEAGRGRIPADRGRVAGPRLGVLLERHVPRGRPVAERAEDLIDGRLGRVAPARRERAGRQPRRHPAGLAQTGTGPVQVTEAERRQHQVEAAVPERQRGRVGRHRVQASGAPAQHGRRGVGADHVAGPGLQRGPPRPPPSPRRHQAPARPPARPPRTRPPDLRPRRPAARGPSSVPTGSGPSAHIAAAAS